MRSTVLVCLTPVWAGLWAWGLFKQPPSAKFWIGISLALIGVAWMGLSCETNTNGASLRGDLLAVAGGILSGTYLIIGQAIRPRVDWARYGALLCASCAAWLAMPRTQLLPACIHPRPFPPPLDAPLE